MKTIEEAIAKIREMIEEERESIRWAAECCDKCADKGDRKGILVYRRYYGSHVAAKAALREIEDYITGEGAE